VEEECVRREIATTGELEATRGLQASQCRMLVQLLWKVWETQPLAFGPQPLAVSGSPQHMQE